MTAVADERPLLGVRGLAKRYGGQVGCLDVGFDLWPGEVLGRNRRKVSPLAVLLHDEPSRPLL
jgi:ABC-type phosphonate transport system ATPase subunit